MVTIVILVSECIKTKKKKYRIHHVCMERDFQKVFDVLFLIF